MDKYPYTFKGSKYVTFFINGEWQVKNYNEDYTYVCNYYGKRLEYTKFLK